MRLCFHLLMSVALSAQLSCLQAFAQESAEKPDSIKSSGQGGTAGQSQTADTEQSEKSEKLLEQASESMPSPSPVPSAPAPLFRMQPQAGNATGLPPQAGTSPGLPQGYGFSGADSGSRLPPMAPSYSQAGTPASGANPAYELDPGTGSGLATGSGSAAGPGPAAGSDPAPRVFNLQAQQIDMRIPRQGPPMMPGDPRFGQMPAPYPGAVQQSPFYGNAQQLNANANQNGPGRLLSQIELQRLAAHDVVLLIDRSASMAAMDCPKGDGPSGHTGFELLPALLGIQLNVTSRWNWCLQQTSDLARETQGIYDQGITVVLFSTGFITFPNVSMRSLPEIFSRNFPAGGTNLAPALGSQIGQYFQRRAYARGNVKPLLIGIITDGCPTSKQAVRDAIIEATRLMRNPREITIIFFMVGAMDFMGTSFVNDLCNNLPAQGAAFPIVRQVSFEELQRIGLAKAIAENLQ